jgi:ribosomal protein S18 acetylase RimI-like enzyme
LGIEAAQKRARKDSIALRPFAQGAVGNAELFDLYEAALRGYIDLAFGWDEAMQRQRFRASYDPADIWLVEVSGETTGYIAVKTDHGQLHLSLLILKPRFQRRGIGRKVMDALVAMAAETGAGITLSCFLSNTGAKAFYESLGFAATAQDEHFVTYCLSTTAG